MKKILVILISILLLLPTNASAAVGMVGESFSAGDTVAVHIINDTAITGFTVVRNSAASDQYVWLMLDGSVKAGTGIPQIYDEDYSGHVASNDYITASIRTELETAVGKLNWRYGADGDQGIEKLRLLDAQDLDQLGIANATTPGGAYSIMANRKSIAPMPLTAEEAAIGMVQEDIDYWTMIKGPTSTEVYVVKLNAAYDGSATTPVATIVTEDIAGLSTPTHAYRPVVKVHKQYIDCKTGETTKKTTTPSNPKTAAVELPTQLLGVAIIAGVAYLVVRKKSIFTKI